MKLRDRIAAIIEGEAMDDFETLKKYSRDTSIFERLPSIVVFPKHARDVQAVVSFVKKAAEHGEKLSIAPRAAGTDMSGGVLTDSIALVFSKYMNAVQAIDIDSVTAEPGIYYRDLEKKLPLGSVVPAYPASREICALGGMIGNNSGGELTLRYGKMADWVRELDVVLSDGSEIIVKPLAPSELESKKSQSTLEGAIYRGIDALITKNERDILGAKPTVTKNSCGYPLWDVRRPDGTFDLTRLITGSQGTLGIVTKARIGIVAPKKHKSMLVIFLSNLDVLPETVSRVLAQKPESFESYDDQTFRLAIRFLPQILLHFGFVRAAQMAFSFLPEARLALTGGVPKLILLAEFAEDTIEAAHAKAHAAQEALLSLPLSTRITKSDIDSAKYWIMRRESFALLRKNLHNLYAAPFIDDIIVHPADYPRFLPELTAILKQYDLVYTIAGHIGDANFHIIPLVSLENPRTRRDILELEDKVYDLVVKYRGSISGEHNDGIIRTPYLPLMYGDRIVELFAEVKRLFDPLCILNPGKKVGGTKKDIERSMITHR